MRVIELRWVRHDSPLGPLTLIGGSGGLVRIEFSAEPAEDTARWARDWVAESAVLIHDEDAHKTWRSQLNGYFQGSRTEFTGGIDLKGPEFYMRVWKKLLRIKYGTTRSYGGLAKALRRPGAAQAVGHACGDNPIPIVVPCHRVVGARGELTGYAGGLDAKRWLLHLEGALPQQELFAPEAPAS